MSYSHYFGIHKQPKFAFDFDECVDAVSPTRYLRVMNGPFDSREEAERAHVNAYGFLRNRGKIYPIDEAKAYKRITKDRAAIAEAETIQ